MKLHYIAPTFFPKNTGFAIAFYNIVKVFAKDENLSEIIVYTPEEEEPFIDNKVRYVRLGKLQKSNKLIDLFGKRLGLFVTKLYMRDEIKKVSLEKDDFVLVESIFLSHIASVLSKKYGKDRVVTRVHGALPEVAYWTKEKFRNNMMQLFLQSEMIAVTTYHYIDYLITYFNLSQTNNRKFMVLPNTLPEVSQTEINFKVREANKGLNIIQLGRMDAYGFFQKGFQDSFQALLLLSKKMDKSRLKKINYTVIGDGDFQPEFSNGLKKIENINVIEHKRLPNAEVLKLIEAADIVLLPSRYEGMSMFATEALSKGKAFIFTNDGGMRDMIYDKVNGISVRPFDYEQIADAIVFYMNNPQKIDEHSKKSIEIFNAKFSHNHVTNQTKFLVDLMTK